MMRSMTPGAKHHGKAWENTIKDLKGLKLKSKVHCQNSVQNCAQFSSQNKQNLNKQLVVLAFVL